jgi:hypothetical protein
MTTMNEGTFFKRSGGSPIAGKSIGTVTLPLSKATRGGRWLCFTVLAMALVLHAAPVSPVHAASLDVNSLLDTSTARDGYCTLREALQNANENADTTDGDCAPGSGDDTITFSVTGAITLESNLPDVRTNVTINGPGAAALTLDGSGTSSIFTVSSTGWLSLEKLTLTTKPWGYRLDAIVNYGRLSVANSTFSANMVSIANYPGGSVTIIDSLFSGNYGDGGGVNNEGGSVTVAGSMFSDNYGGHGGGIFSDGGSVSITNSTFSGNTGQIQGGGIYNIRGTLTITGSTFSNNKTDYNPLFGGGGGIYNGNGTAVVTNCTFSGNTAGYWMGQGGGIMNENNATLTVKNSIFTDNLSYGGGGGIHNQYLSRLTVDHSTFSSNIGDEGGGISNDRNSTATVTDSTFSSNNGTYRGGGIYNFDGSTLAVTGSTFSGNRGRYYGGGIDNFYYSTAMVTNSTFSDNIAGSDIIAGSGGGISNDYNSTIIVTDGTFAGNSANSLGGGIYNTGQGTLTLKNTIIANGSTGENCSGDITDGGYNLESGTTCGFSGLNHSYPNTDPLLDPDGLKDNGGTTPTIALQLESPAIDAIPNGANGCGTTITTDQRGFTRPQGPGCDIGAFEATVRTPHQATEDLIDQVGELVGEGALNQGQGNALIAKLHAAIQQLDRGNEHVAINQIQAFIQQVQAMIRSGVLLPEEGQPLIEAANGIIAALSG